MYTDFYNLREKPFDLTPSSRFLYLGEVHKEALALLTYGVEEKKGFVLLTGDVGTGKTTMIHALLNNLDKNTLYVHLSNPLLSPTDFLKHLAHEVIKKNFRFKTRREVLLEFESFLKQCIRKRNIFVLIVDEAQKLSFDLLEEIRLLSNMETGEEKLINILLVAQPEFNKKLSEPRCKPILQRIGIRYHMKPLDMKGTREYILTRLRLAGAEDGTKIFQEDAIISIYGYSKGYPRMINIIADNTLLLGYSRDRKKVTIKMVEECYRDIRPEEQTGNAVEHHKNPFDNRLPPMKGFRKYWRWVAFFFMFAIIILIVAVSLRFFIIQQQGIDMKVNDLEEEIKAFKSDIKRYQLQLIDVLKREQEVQNSDKSQLSSRHDATNEQMNDNQNNYLNEVRTGNPSIEMRNVPPSWPIIIVKEGDNIARLMKKIYGRTGQDILDMLRTYNPELKDINSIYVGQNIIFPPLSEIKNGRS